MIDMSPLSDFENVIQLIHDARNRAASKVNEELVMLYFSVGNIVSVQVAREIWGNGTVNELANFIESKMPGIGGFNRRGLYRMKQFFESYSIRSDCYKLWLDLQADENHASIVSPVATQLPDNLFRDP